MTFRREAGKSSSAVRFRSPRIVSFSKRSGLVTRVRRRRPSDAHRHDHGHVREVRARRAGPDYGWVELAADADLDLVVRDRAQYVEEVARVEADGELGTRVVHGELVEAFAALGAFALEP